MSDNDIIKKAARARLRKGKTGKRFSSSMRSKHGKRMKRSFRSKVGPPDVWGDRH